MNRRILAIVLTCFLLTPAAYAEEGEGFLIVEGEHYIIPDEEEFAHFFNRCGMYYEQGYACRVRVRRLKSTWQAAIYSHRDALQAAYYKDVEGEAAHVERKKLLTKAAAEMQQSLVQDFPKLFFE